jgi:hypothetical protein
MSRRVDWSIKVRDVLTTLTIAISVTALVLSWSKDRAAQKTERANRVRDAAASILTKLDRWQALQLSLYQELQPAFVEASEQLQKQYDTVLVRDQVWKSVNAQRTHIASKILEEHLEIAYAEILPHFPAARAKFTEAYEKLTAIEEANTMNFLAATEEDVLAFDGKEKHYTTAMLGNALRKSATQYRSELRKETEEVIQPMREYLFDVISKTDDEILGAARSTSNSMKD